VSFLSPLFSPTIPDKPVFLAGLMIKSPSKTNNTVSQLSPLRSFLVIENPIWRSLGEDT